MLHLFVMINLRRGEYIMNKIIRVVTRLLLGFIVYGLAIVVMIHLQL